MAATDTTFQQDSGTPGQLPQGAATELNNALPTETASAPASDAEAAASEAAAEQEVPVEMAAPADYEPVFQPASEEDDFIAGPTLRPDEPQTLGTSRRAPIPANVRRSLPVLQRLAAEPGASPQLIALVALLTREAS